MNTTVEALKGLYVAFGGSLTDHYSDIAGNVNVSDYVLIPDCIKALAKIAASAVAKELPEVSATDNGSVLKVVDGKWAVGTDNIQA
jgi:hypothetical protein